jgi:hypothetical protein
VEPKEKKSVSLIRLGKLFFVFGIALYAIVCTAMVIYQRSFIYLMADIVRLWNNNRSSGKKPSIFGKPIKQQNNVSHRHTPRRHEVPLALFYLTTQDLAHGRVP